MEDRRATSSDQFLTFIDTFPAAELQLDRLFVKGVPRSNDCDVWSTKRQRLAVTRQLHNLHSATEA